MKEDMNRLRLIERYEPIAINTVDEGRSEPIKIAIERYEQIAINTVDEGRYEPIKIDR